MNELLTTRRSAVPKSWAARFARWRETGGAEIAIQLIMAAAPRRKLEAASWNAMEVQAALDCLHAALPRAAARRRRLAGLLIRIRAAQPKPRPLYYIGGYGMKRLRIRRVLGAGGTADKVRAIGTREEMQALLAYTLTHWASLPYGREVETAAEQLGSKAGPAGGAPEERRGD